MSVIHKDLLYVLRRMQIDAQEEMKSFIGVMDIIIKDKLIIELNGNVHYYKNREDLKTFNKRYKAKLLGY